MARGSGAARRGAAAAAVNKRTRAGKWRGGAHELAALIAAVAEEVGHSAGPHACVVQRRPHHDHDARRGEARRGEARRETRDERRETRDERPSRSRYAERARVRHAMHTLPQAARQSHPRASSTHSACRSRCLRNACVGHRGMRMCALPCRETRGPTHTRGRSTGGGRVSYAPHR